jgi:hypothetical protein
MSAMRATLLDERNTRQAATQIARVTLHPEHVLSQ